MRAETGTVEVAGETLAHLDRAAQRELLVGAAASVLAAYGLGGAHVRLLERKTNITFRVDAAGAGGGEPQRFLLRVCQAGTYDRQALASEGTWLLALRAAGLVVPEPVATRDGSRVASVLLPGQAEPRWCVLFRWVPGRIVESAVDPAIIEQVGELGARIHNVAASFVPPPGFARPRWDCDRLFGRGEVIPAGRGEPLITRRTREILAAAAALLRQDIAALGEGREVFGLIHKDLEPDNTVIDEGRVHAIDFADCGWGHYLYDIAASLLPLREKKGYPELREAFLRGYRRHRPLRPEHEALIDTFLIARSLFTIRFMVLTSLDERPELLSYAERVIPLMVGEVRRFLEKRAGAGEPSAPVARAGKATVIQLLTGLRDRGVKKIWAEGEKLRFTAPPGALTPEIKADLAERKAEIIAFLRQGETVTLAAGPARRPLPEGTPAPLSFAQQRLWFLDQLNPGSAEYNITRAVRLSGALRVDVLGRAMGEVIRRHSVLRTTFGTVDGVPVQVVAPLLTLPLPVVDLRALPPGERLAEARRLVDSAGRRPFDLERGPLLRLRVLRLAETEHLVGSTMHHIVSDGWSTGLLFREMGVLYQAFLAGLPSPLPELPIQYTDFAVWQRAHLDGEVLTAQLAWWRQHFAGSPDSLDLPTDRPRSAVRTSRGALCRFVLAKAPTDALRAIARAEGATLFMVLFAAWNALLSRTSGQEDVVVGIPIANRNRTEIEGLIGFFVNTLALRVDLSGDPAWRELLTRVRRVTVGAYAHQDLPFERLVEELRPERALAANPLFQVMFAQQTGEHEESLSLPGLTMSPSPLGSAGGAAKFDLTLSLVDGEAGIRGSLEYRAELFDAPTAVRLLEHFRVLLEGIAAGSDHPLSELPLLTAAERHQLLVAWNDTAGPDPARSIHELFRDRARAAPEAIALQAGEEVITYNALEERARRLAGRLRALGVGPESLVGLALDRSPRAVTAMLAVLAAGGAFVPLDPSSPPERLRLMAEDAGLRLVLTGAALDELEDGSGEPVVPLPRTTAPDALAYVMFTSGSTGRPKGVAVPHRAVVRLVRAATWARLGPEETFLQLAPLAFDASTLEIWGCLLNGGRLVIAPEGRLSLTELGRVIAQGGVTTLWLTAGLFHQMAEAQLAALRPLRQLLAGGDVLSPEHVRRTLEELPGLTLVNGYGPTENTTFTCCHPMTDPRQIGVPVPVGRPIGGTRVFLLDRWLAPAPIGVVGELYAAGEGLARGYAGRPELTAERFVPHPFPTAPGERLYRTGDLARFRPDGSVEFLGRADHQVKLRGFRIELGEIEATLTRLPPVRDAVVVVREEGEGDKRLVAYVALMAGAAGDAAALREALRGSLPELMIPASFVFLDTFPLNANGKVDRRALARAAPVPAAERPEEAPRDEVEELLAGIWAEVLRRARVGRGDDFFRLGGHSLLATQVVSRVRETFGIELPLQRLFEASTLAALAAAVREALREELGAAPLPPVQPVPREGGLPLSFAQQRLWFLDRFDPGSAAYNIPVAMRLAGGLEPAALARALRGVARRHESLRTTFSTEAGHPVQVIAPEVPLALPLVDLGALPEPGRGTEARRLAAAEAARPFDLAAGPLVRATLLRLAEQEHAAVITLHHIIADGWSMGVFLAELAALYPACLRNEPDPLPPLPVQYADFACWQRRWLAGEVLAGELAHWRSRLAGAARTLDLPTDRPRPVVQTFRGRSLPIVLPLDAAERVARLARRQGATPFMVLLAAFQVLLGRLARQDDLVVGTPIAGRNRREIEGLIGFFVNTLVLRTDLSGDPSGSALLARVRQVALDGYAHQDIPFERLVEELQPERDLSANPLFQVMFALQNAPRGAFVLPGLTLTPLAVAGETAKFDLTLSLQEGEGGLRGSLEINTGLFDTVTAVRWLRSLQALLAALTADPDRRLSMLPWLAVEERHQLLVDCNATGSTGPADLCLHALFAAQASHTPDAVALVRGGQRLSYGELACRVDRLARHLRTLGVGPEERVGVCLERGVDLVVALLGVLAAGGAYVPLDPLYPPERLAFMIDDAGGRLLLTQESLLPRLPAAVASVVCLDGLPAAAAPGDLCGAERRPGPGNLAYVIYTSGSTGRPKGVAIEHRSAVAMVRWARGVFTDEELDGVLAATSVCFDLSVFELFVPLAWGGRVILAENALELPALDPLAQVRLINTVPSAMAELIRQGAVPASVCTVNLAGEALQGTLVERIYRSTGVRRVLNLYGPTEDTTYSTFAPVPAGGGEPTIGRALPGTRAYALDGRLEPVPLGVPGELFLGGEGLARGYLGRPEQTAASFVPDPFAAPAGEPGGRLYRTGDLVRLLPSGELQYLGRIDQQVKVRGFRIELGEIEVALARQPGVRDAVVLVRDDAAGDRRLVAYVAATAALPAGELRQALRRRLPEHMLPAAFVFLDALPLTPNGKLDRRALARLAPEAPAAAEDTAAVWGEIEQLLAGIWAAVLGRERVGGRESFFEIGGHSLLAAQVLSRVREVLKVELPLQTLFTAPTVVAFAAAVRAALRAGGETPAPPLTPLPPGSRAGGLPLSFAQQRLWFVDQLQPGSAAYNIPAAVRLRGSLDLPALTAAAGEVVRRHEALRTTFALRGGEPVQVIAPAPGPPALNLPLADLAALPAPAREEAARLLAGEAARRPFDLQAGPLLRISLLRLEDREHVALVSFHHIVSDGWSMGVFLGELAALYAAFTRREPSPLAGLPVQYADFAHWQRHWLRGEVLAAELGSWKERLAGMPQALELPTDRPRPALQSFRGRTLAVAVPPELTEKLIRLGRSAGATPFMVLLAAFQVLLGRLADRAGVAVGTPIAGRNRREIEGLIGFFANTLVLYTDLSGEPTVRGLLDRVRQVALHGYTHQDIPFERLVEELQPQRDLRLNPLFQVLFALQNAPFGTLELPGLRLEPVEAESGTAKFDLSLSLREWQGGLRGALEYCTDLFDAATPERWWQSFLVLLAAAVEDPDRSLMELPWLAPAERQQLLAGCNETGSTGRPDRCLHELVAAQAARTPEAVALVRGGEALTYRELEERAEALARVLRSRGVGPEERVGVCLERGPDLIAALLGVLKAGGAYVPLDPAYPPERLEFMIGDAGGRVLVTREAFLDRLPGSGVEALCLEKGLPAAAGQTPGWRAAEPGNLAYLIYTSGSTGRPKGVAIEHRSAVAMVRWARGVFSDEELAGVLAATSVCFDLSVFEIFAPLAWGGRVILADNALELAAPAPLAAGTEVRLVNTVPSALAELVRLGALPPTVRTVNLAGEALQGALVEKIYRQETVRRVYNLYGPSEDTTYSTFVRVEKGSGEPTIGVPLTGTRAYVLDRRLEPVPVGVPGELLLAGEGLARCYLGRPDKTAEVFVPDPFGGSGGRLYRTGDLVRRLAGGELQYLGRLDHQVKVRGFRIELGEIEAALARCPGVCEGAVLVREATPGDKRLVAYVVVSGGELSSGDSGAAELRAALQTSLPEPMVPSAFVFLDALPLTPNGKVDRRALALRGPDGGGAERSGERIAPRDTLELQLAGVWEELLGVAPVGVRDDFFSLGGHSLLGVRLIARIRERCGRTLPLTALMQRPTIEGLAAELRRGAGPVRREPLVPIRPEGARPPLFLVHPIGGNVLCYADLARQIGPERAVYGLQVPDPVDATATVEAMAVRYLEAARAARPGGPWLLGGWSLGGVVAFEMARQLAAAGEEVGLLALIDAYAQGLGPQADPGTGPAGAVDEAALVPLFVRDLEGLLGMPLPLPHGELRALPPEEALRQVLAEVRRRGLQPPDVREEDLRSLFAMFRANALAFRRYVPRPYAGRVTLFRAGEWAAAAAADPSLGWSRVAAGGLAAIEAIEVPGSHYTLLQGERAAFLAGRLREKLAGALAS